MILSFTVKEDDVTKDIARSLDYPFDGTTKFEVPEMPEVPKDFGVGLIVGPSGSGKSHLLKRFGEEEDIIWDSQRPVCSHFDSAMDAKERLSAVGFNSIPSWLRPYQVLSTGEKFRADVARKLRAGAVIDEFTSVVDRTVAKSCAFSVHRYVTQKNLKGIVFATCHYDVIEWLMPDWIFDTGCRRLTTERLLRRPEINVEVLPCDASLWPLFRPHHYLDKNINHSARCWVAVWEQRIVGFAAALTFPSGTIKERAWRGHRTVILPDYQGLGIGVRLSDAVASIFKADGCRYFSKTAHPRMGEYRNNSTLWRPTSKNQKARLDYNPKRKTKAGKNKMRHATRVCYSHEFIGKQP